jgi:carbon dioxide concentrating mechanism protein CcmM
VLYLWTLLRSTDRKAGRSVARHVVVSLLGVALAVVVTGCDSGTAQENQKAGSTQQADGGAEGSPQRSAPSEGGGQHTNIGRPAKVVFGSSYMSPLTEAFGDVLIGRDDFVSASTALRAAPGLRLKLGNQSTVHDNVIVRAREKSVTIGDQTALAHHAIVRDSEIGNSVYIGYSTEVSNSRIGNGAIIYHGAEVDGVEIPDNRYVGAGEVVRDQATADALPTVEESGVDKYYSQDLLEVDQELRKGYIKLYEREGYDAVMDAGPNPKTSFNPEEVEPQIDNSVKVDEFVRIVGDVQVGENSTIGRRTAIRADEGSPIIIGPGAVIDDRVTFHAIKGTEVQIGKYLVAGDDSVLHGPLKMGDDDVVGAGAVVFRVRVGDNVQIGEGAVIVGPVGKDLTLDIPDDTIIPSDAVVTSKKDLEALKD